MKWHKIEEGNNPLLKSRVGDYLFFEDESNPAGVDAVSNLYSIAYVDEAAVNVFNMLDGRQMVRTQRYYESGHWFYMPLPQAFR